MIGFIGRKSTSSRLRHLMTLQEEMMAPDGVGGYARSWQDIADVWAEIAAATGKEIAFGGQIESRVTHRITLRYRDGVSAGQRLVFEDRAFNIRYIADNGENRDTLQLLAEEGGGA